MKSPERCESGRLTSACRKSAARSRHQCHRSRISTGHSSLGPSHNRSPQFQIRRSCFGMRQSRVLHLLSFVTLAVFVDPPSVGAAERPVTLGATVGASTQGAGKSDLPYLGPPFGGTTVGSIVFIDAERGTIWSVGVEMSLATAITGTQRSRGNPRLGGSF